MRSANILFVVLLLGTASDASTQTSDVCEHGGARMSPSALIRPVGGSPLNEQADREVIIAIQDIVDHTGLLLNFSMAESNIPNAMAYMDTTGSRLLLFNPDFILQIHDRVNHDWGVTSILAHEVGHHLQGHIFLNDAGFYHRELEADEFSGFAIYRMGGTLAEAQSVVRQLTVDQDMPTHPGRQTRLAAIARGWLKAQAITAHEAEAAARRTDRERRAGQGHEPSRSGRFESAR